VDEGKRLCGKLVERVEDVGTVRDPVGGEVFLLEVGRSVMTALGRIAGGSELFTLGLGRHVDGFLDGTLDGAVGRDVDGLLDGGRAAAAIARSSESFVVFEDEDIVVIVAL
jgi:hypothetical protein